MSPKTSSKSKAEKLSDNINSRDRNGLYQILGVTEKASVNVIKKAYYHLALRYHPDRNPTEKDAKTHFQRIGQAYEILSDPTKRRLYDQTGIIEGCGMDSESATWMDYFRELFQRVTMADLDEFRTRYVGSAEEYEDILAAYVKHQGDIAQVTETIYFGDVDSEDRYLNLIKRAIARGIVPSYERADQIIKDEAAFRAQQRKRKRKAAREAEEAMELAQELGLYGHKDENGNDRLTSLIQERQRGRFETLINNLETRYGSSPSTKGNNDASHPDLSRKVKRNKK